MTGSPAVDEEQSWTCIGCAMTARYRPPRSGSTPSGWVRGTRGWLCLNCRREEVVTAVPSTRDAASRAARRRALIEFELGRDPGASDGQIAGRAKTSAATVRPIRAELLSRDAPA